MTGKPLPLHEKLIELCLRLLPSITSKTRKTYVGYTSGLTVHTADKSVYTKDFKPWSLIGFVGFDKKLKALRFERYLKSNVGKIFIKRYFI